jgi:hypothetical protein
LCVELPLELFIESDRLPTEAEPALEADEAKLSARQAGTARMPTRIAQANRIQESHSILRQAQWLAAMWHSDAACGSVARDRRDETMSAGCCHMRPAQAGQNNQ